MYIKKATLLLTSMFACSQILYAGGDIVPVYEPVTTDVNMEQEYIGDKEGHFFVFASGGASFFSVDTKIARGRSFTKGSTDNSTGAYELGAGYYIRENIFTELAYQQSMLDLADVDSIYMSINYAFTDMMFSPYVGALLGYSTLDWETAPYNAGISNDVTSDSSIYGVQAGASYPLMNHLSLSAKYQYITLDHILNITNGTGEIKHNNVQQIFGGLKYEF